jgi:hypothetical protein
LIYKVPARKATVCATLQPTPLVIVYRCGFPGSARREASGLAKNYWRSARITLESSFSASRRSFSDLHRDIAGKPCLILKIDPLFGR